MRWLVALSLIGCFREASAPPANRAQPQERHASGDSLAYLPADAELVVALDIPQIRATATWQKYEAVFTQGQLSKLTTVCGIDITAIQRVTFGMRSAGGKVDGVVVVRGVPREPFMKCIVDPKFTSRQVVVVGDVISATDRDSGDTVAMRFVDGRTLVAQFQAGANASTLDARIRAGSPLRSSPVFADILARIDTSAPLWFAAAGSSKVFDGLARMGYPVKSAGGSIRAGDGFEVTARARFETPATAQQLAATLRAQLGPLQPFVDSIDVVDEDVEVKVTVKITEAQVDRLITMAGLAGSLGGP